MLEDRGLLAAFSPDADIHLYAAEPESAGKKSDRVDGSDAINLQIVTELETLKDLWKQFETEAVCTVFQSWHWVSLWHKHKSREEEIRPIFVIGREGKDAKPLFIWPLQIKKQFGQNILEWFGQSHSSYNMGLYRQDAFSKITAPVLEHIVNRLTAFVPDIDLIELLNQPEVWNGYRNPLCSLSFDLAPNASYGVALEKNFETVFQNSVSAKSRSNLRRYEKKLRTTGHMEIEQSRKQKCAQTILQTYFEQKAAQFAEQGIVNVFSDEGLQSFYHDLCQDDQASCSALQCHALKIDNDIQATCIGISFQKRYYLLMLSMTTGPSKQFAPGRILMRHEIEACCTKGYSFYDMGAGAGQHKAEWSNQTCQLVDSMFPVSFKGRALAIFIQTKRRFKRMIKNNQKLWAFAKFLRKRLKGHIKHDLIE